MAFLLVLAFVSASALPFDTHLSSTDGSEITFTIQNIDPNPVAVKTFGTPLLEVPHANLFAIVSDSGVSAVYTGPKIRRNSPSDVITLASGEVREAQFNVIQSYRFPVEGTYQVTLNAWISYQVDGATDFVVDSLTTPESISLTITADQVVGDVSLDVNDGTITFNDCPASWQSQLSAQMVLAEGLAQKAIDYLSAVTCDTPATLFEKWYGPCTPDRLAGKLAGFQRVLARMTGGFSFQCDPVDCQDPTLDAAAFVFPDDATFTVNVCAATFDFLPTACNFDAIAGVLLHEFTHFDPIMATDDIVGDEAGILALAKSNPNQAFINSYTQEFFSEETCAVTITTPAPTTTEAPTTPTPTPTSTPTPTPHTGSGGKKPTPKPVVKPKPKKKVVKKPKKKVVKKNKKDEGATGNKKNVKQDPVKKNAKKQVKKGQNPK